MHKFFFILLILKLGSLLSSGVERAEFYDDFKSTTNAFTDVGELPINKMPWFGPIQIVNNSQEPLSITGYHSLDLNLEIITVPEKMIPAGSEGTIEVLYQPQSIGLLTPRLELTTSQGRKTALLRVLVTAKNEWEILGFAWPELAYRIDDISTYLVDAKSVIESIRKLPLEKQPTIIDPRPSEEHENAYIPGALHLPLHELLDRPHWHDRLIYIIDEGSLQTDRISSLIRLKEAGFENLYWISGGMRAWQAAGGKLMGPAAETGQWSNLSPRQVANSLLRNEFIILNAAGTDTIDKLNSLFPKSQHFQWGDALEFIEDTPPRLLVVAKSNDAYLNVEQVLKGQGITQVYYLDEGVDRLIRNLKAWNTPESMRFRLLQSGARNPLGKKLPITLVDRDCIDCLKRSRQ